MKQLIDKYAAKLVGSGLAEPGAPLIGGLDADLRWNRADRRTTELEGVFEKLNINSLLFARPAEPYFSIIEYLAAQNGDAIFPNDCETRTFLHDLPVIEAFDADLIVAKLKQRKSVIVKNHGIVTWGTVTPEQAFIFFSSVCFACFVKFFSDYLTASRQQTVSRNQQRVFEAAIPRLDLLPEKPPRLLRGPFASEAEVYKAISEAGRLTVEYRLVDSFFGNVSFLKDDCLYISQTGSSLDELDGFIDPCPLDDSSCSSITASSEFIAHRDVVTNTDADGILHGHPKFSVIMSMFCERENCEFEGQCHIKCPEKRFIHDIPIVPGEVGAGPRGLCHTLPPAMVGTRGAIVYGHGVFTPANTDFNNAFANLLAIERMCQENFLKLTVR
jgi:ribulose-5-phosphate 4-epimerase/fuculose-1-phosphate aldolase